MGAAARALVVAAAVLAARSARADSCTGTSDRGAKFETCFDVGNRLSVTAGSGGFGFGIQLRQIVKFDDDPDLDWKLDHAIATVEDAAWQLDGRLTGTLYTGHFIRHTRDGHIVLPLGSPPKKVFLPFDIGAVVEGGRVTVRDDAALMTKTMRIGVVETAAVVDLWRTRDFKRRLIVGPVAHYDIDLARAGSFHIARHLVAPFTRGLANLHLESRDGLYVADFAVEAGKQWRGDTGTWQTTARATARVERIVMAIDDRPIALVVDGGYDSEFKEYTAGVGARIVLFHATDSRVSKL